MATKRPDKKTSRSSLGAQERTESAALRRIWLEYKERTGESQQKFAGALDMTQGNFNHYLDGRQPLNMAIAVKFAKRLECKVEDFSQRLVHELLAYISDLPDFSRDAPVVLTDTLERDLMTMYRELKPPGRDSVYGNATRLLAEQRRGGPDNIRSFKQNR